MTFSEWVNTKVQKCNFVDIQFIKICTAAFILMVAKLWEPILSLDWYWYLIIAVLAAIKPVTRVFGK